VAEWRELRLDRLRPEPVACRLCGRPLFARVWSDEHGEFCDPDCAGLFVAYWLPRHGPPPEG
jgi:hypothetical protein